MKTSMQLATYFAVLGGAWAGTTFDSVRVAGIVTLGIVAVGGAISVAGTIWGPSP